MPFVAPRPVAIGFAGSDTDPGRPGPHRPGTGVVSRCYPPFGVDDAARRFASASGERVDAMGLAAARAVLAGTGRGTRSRDDSCPLRSCHAYEEHRRSG